MSYLQPECENGFYDTAERYGGVLVAILKLPDEHYLVFYNAAFFITDRDGAQQCAAQDYRPFLLLAVDERGCWIRDEVRDQRGIGPEPEEQRAFLVNYYREKCQLPTISLKYRKINRSGSTRYGFLFRGADGGEYSINYGQIKRFAMTEEQVKALYLSIYLGDPEYVPNILLRQGGRVIACFPAR